MAVGPRGGQPGDDPGAVFRQCRQAAGESPKLYFNDTGLLCFLLGIGADDLGRSPLTGPIWENFVCAELRTRLQLTRPDWSLWFYRDQQNREADFLIQGPYERIRLLDAKWAETARGGAFAALDAVAAVLRNASGISDVEVGLVGRMAATRRLGASRTAVSGFRVADFLPADD